MSDTILFDLLRNSKTCRRFQVAHSKEKDCDKRRELYGDKLSAEHDLDEAIKSAEREIKRIQFQEQMRENMEGWTV